MNSLITSSHAKGFLWGAASTLLIVYIVSTTHQNITNSRNRRRRNSADSQPDVQEEEQRAASSLIQAPQGPSLSSSVRILDAPDLDLRLIRKAEAVIRFRTSSLIIIIERCTNDHNYSAILRTAEALGIQHVWIVDALSSTASITTATTSTTSLEGPDHTAELDREELEENGFPSQDDHHHDESLPSTNTSTGYIKIPGTALRLSAEEVEQRRKHRLFAQNATEWITIRDFVTTAECLQACREQGYAVWATDLSQEAVPLTPRALQQYQQQQEDDDEQENVKGDRRSIRRCWPLPKKLAIVFGTEAVGCTQEMLHAADLRVYLPLRGFADSLNLSVATALVVHHLFLLNPAYSGQMSEEERRQLRVEWFSKLARQRLLSNRDKKTRQKLINHMNECRRLQAKHQAGQPLTSDQINKISRLAEYERQLQELESDYGYNQAHVIDQAVADLVEHPPEPLTDLRRADPHRVTFVGKKTKRQNSDHWKNMTAVGTFHPVRLSTAAFFRHRVRSIAASPCDNKQNEAERGSHCP